MLVVLLLSSAPFAGSQETRRRVSNVEVLDLDGNPCRKNTKYFSSAWATSAARRPPKASCGALRKRRRRRQPMDIFVVHVVHDYDAVEFREVFFLYLP